MPFLLSSQQRQSIEGIIKALQANQQKSFSSKMAPRFTKHQQRELTVI